MSKKPYERKSKNYKSYLDRMIEKEPGLKRLMDSEQIHEDNPYKTLTVSTEGFWETQGILIDFLSQFLAGYVWACTNDINMIAMHEELPAVKALLSDVLGYIKLTADGKDTDFMYGTNFILVALTRLGLLCPQMWD